MSKEWFVMYCKSREESRAFQHLRNQGIEYFFPKIKKEKIIRGKKTITEGAFKGATAIFASNDGLERSVLLLNILSQEKSISFPNKELKRA